MKKAKTLRTKTPKNFAFFLTSPLRAFGADAIIEKVCTHYCVSCALKGAWKNPLLEAPIFGALPQGKEEYPMQDICAYIDHTLLKPEACREAVEKLCHEALQYRFASVCVNSCHVPFCAEKLKGSGVKVCTVVGFPLGASFTEVKAFEASRALEGGAEEIDMVMNLGAFKDCRKDTVEKDIREVKKACGDKILKVILETCLLTEEEIQLACKIAQKGGGDYVKTSTGFSTGGATVEHVALMRATVGSAMGVKASGGIRSIEAALKMIEAGATRIGTSSGVAMVKEKH